MSLSKETLHCIAISPTHFRVLSARVAILSISTNEDLALVQQLAIFHNNKFGDQGKLFRKYIISDEILKLSFNEQQQSLTHLHLTSSVTLTAITVYRFGEQLISI